MNVFHKVLVKIFEITGGRDSVEVDLVDLLKKEGFYSNIESIASQLLDEGWVTEAGRKNTVKITHWGATEAKKVLSNKPTHDGSDLSRDVKRLLGEAKELIVMIEELASKTDSNNLDAVEKLLSNLAQRAKNLRSRI